jgi:hypothetical protein
LAKFPVGEQLSLMQLCPVQNQSQGPPRLRTLQNLKPLNVNHDLMFVIIGMEVRRRMIIEIHPNEDSEKVANRWHLAASLAILPNF